MVTPSPAGTPALRTVGSAEAPQLLCACVSHVRHRSLYRSTRHCVGRAAGGAAAYGWAHGGCVRAEWCGVSVRVLVWQQGGWVGCRERLPSTGIRGSPSVSKGGDRVKSGLEPRERSLPIYADCRNLYQTPVLTTL